MKQVLHGYRTDGTSFTPFDGDNMIDDGYLFDINGDQIIEKVDVSNVSVEGSKQQTIQVLRIDTAELKPRILLAVVLNWHPYDKDSMENRWSWDLVKASEGRWKVVLFPATGTSGKPGAVFEWDAQTHRYLGPDGGKGQHFARLPADENGIWKALEKLQQEGALKYALVSKPAEIDVEKSIPPPPEARAYVRASRQSLSHEALFKFMGPGRNMQTYEAEHSVHDRAPPDYWSLPARQAAMAMVEANRSKEHAQRFQLAIDDREGVKPPESGVIHLSHASSACYNARSWEIMIVFQRGQSWLAYARTVVAGAAFYSPTEHGLHYDFEIHDLNDEDARHLAQTVWWLDRVRSRDRKVSDHGGSFRSSTADGYATLRLTADGRAPLELSGTIYSEPIAKRWAGLYEKEAALNLACYLVEQELPKRWGSGPDFLHQGLPALRGEDADETNRQAIERRKLSAEQMLERIVTIQSKRPVPMVFLRLALLAAGEYGLPVDEFVKAIAPELPPPSEREQELARLQKQIKPRALHADHFTGPTPDENRMHELRSQLDNDLAFTLRDVLPEVQRKLATRNDHAALKMWAESRDQGADWALRRLHDLAKPAYIEALGRRLLELKRKEDVPFATRLFQQIHHSDAPAAASLLPKLGEDVRTACAVFATGQTSSDIEGLLKVLTTKDAGYEAKCAAIQGLIPENEPMRHQDARIDKALLSAMENGAGDYGGVGEQAAAALACRDEAISHWAKFIEFYSRSRSYGLNALDVPCRLALQSGDPKKRADMLSMLQPHFVKTNSYMPAILIAYFHLDLRSDAKALRALATFDDTDIESREASQLGGPLHKPKGKFHLARQILAVWDETDPTTQARLLIAWRVHHSQLGDQSLLLEQIDTQMNALIASGTLSKTDTRNFIDWCHQQTGSLLEQPLLPSTDTWLKSLSKKLQ